MLVFRLKNGCAFYLHTHAGFENVTYFWNLLPIEAIDSFPYLRDCNSIYIYHDEMDKKLFHCVTYWPGNAKEGKIEFLTN